MASDDEMPAREVAAPALAAEDESAAHMLDSIAAALGHLHESRARSRRGYADLQELLSATDVLLVSADPNDLRRFGHECPLARRRGRPYAFRMAPRTIELQPDAYDLVVREAERRGVEPAELVDELVRTDPGQGNGDLVAALDALAKFRAGLPPIDSVALVREGRDELEARGA